MNHTQSESFLLCDSPERLKRAVESGEWTGDVLCDRGLEQLHKGDVLFFYATEPVVGLVGFGKVSQEPHADLSASTVEFQRAFCLPFLLWTAQKIEFTQGHQPRELKPLRDREATDRISKLAHSRWGVDVENAIKEEILDVPIFRTNRCEECGRELDSRRAKYCAQCRTLVRKRQIRQWNRSRRKRTTATTTTLTPEGMESSERHPTPRSENGADWPGGPGQAPSSRKQPTPIGRGERGPATHAQLKSSDWSRQLRNDPAHLSWMRRHGKRMEIIREMERRFHWYWEDKFRHVFNNSTQTGTSKILDLNYQTVVKWAKHLGLKKKPNRKRLPARNNVRNSQPQLEDNYRNTGRQETVKDLLSLIDPTLNTQSLNLTSHSIRGFIDDIMSMLPVRQCSIIRGRYLNFHSDKRLTLAQVGQSLGLSRERVRQLEGKAIAHLSHPSNRKLIRQKLVNVIFTGEPPFESHLLEKITQVQEELDHISGELETASKQKPVSRKPTAADTPVSEITLSVRARNCLDSMGLRTLGELADNTEPEMLAKRNLGKKTLRELSSRLADHGLQFTQISPEHPAANTPLSEIRLSARARKCLDSMGLRTLGELADKTEPEMLAKRNLGPGTLREFSWRLSDHGLKFKQS